ncbi:gas vesicle protein [Ruminiclostridium sufflavum DSM 19573]|uniref:Gas vesicle protein n=1 Tax=Ruminiclostridium sufflavum DSM 19573 TaxID=1121337 RepID=A0A318XP58_9FIRM|nr:YtxH domain-containing protein [Ruminiclostridium sufflavum]PYG88833.1 gas vesicle protein [Ruminiclostridium sufflavum DSM 19573]
MNLRDLFQKKKPSKKQTAKNVAIGAGIGTAVGVTAGVLLAPKSGKETREDISKTTKQTLENVKDGLNVAKEKIEEMVKKEKCTCGAAAEAAEENVSDKAEETKEAE